jgi:hypothetical protein
MAGLDAPPRFYSTADRDGDFNGAPADPDLVTEAWRGAKTSLSPNSSWPTHPTWASSATRRGRIDLAT